MKNALRIMSIGIIIFVQLTLCLYLYETHKLKIYLPNVYFNILFLLAGS